MRDERREWAVIHFPNQSRFFDRTRRAVHFWGHDSAMEWSFFIGEDALKHLQPDMPPDEAGLLNAFDFNRALIQAAAMKAYKRERKPSYELADNDFLHLKPAARPENEPVRSLSMKESSMPSSDDDVMR